MRVVILSSSSAGLHQDAKLIEQVLREANASGHFRITSIDHMDPVSFYGSPHRTPRAVDVQIHLEVPCRAAWRWARYNIVVVNQEWWRDAAWKWVLAPVEKGGAHMLIFKSHYARSLFPELEGKRCRVVAWRCGSELQTSLSGASDKKPEFLYLVGASVNKLAAAKTVCEAWRPDWPALRVVAVPTALDELRAAVPDATKNGVVLQAAYESDAARVAAQVEHGYHVVASAAEGFGHTFAEAAALGALPLWTDIPVYKELWGPIVGNVGKISGGGDIATAVESLLGLTEEEERKLRGALRHASATRIKEFRTAWKALLGAIDHKLKSTAALAMPPRALAAAELPRVAIISLTRNRPRWFTNMARNILNTEYPTDKLSWVIVDDSDGDKRVDEAVMKFQTVHTKLDVRYVSLARPLSVGAKRNRGCEAAPADADVFVMMDDDDYYPACSVAARITWLVRSGAECVYCSTIPMYDCRRYISAVNVPPLDLSPAERVSEASLCFTRKFITDRKFPADASMAEGEGFIVGREEQTVEIPPEGILVSFIHGANASSRRVPEASEPNGCHYGFDDDYFSYITSMAS